MNRAGQSRAKMCGEWEKRGMESERVENVIVDIKHKYINKSRFLQCEEANQPANQLLNQTNMF